MNKLILITNDDGVQSTGLLVLRQALSAMGETAVIAPEKNMSATGHSRRLYEPLRARPVVLSDGSEALACDGTPADCVALALLGLLPRRPDLIVSGINHGANLANDITYSGTIAAAMEGTLNGVLSIAVSLCGNDQWDFRAAAQVALRLAQSAYAHRLPADVLLNINVPPGPPEEVTQVQVTRTGRHTYQDKLVVRHDPFGRPYYWVSSTEPHAELEVGTDVAAIAAGYISVTPIHMDLTGHHWIEELRSWATG